MMTFEVYTDGGCRGNPGKGAWAYAVYQDGKLLTSDYGAVNQTTNNRMELYAIYAALTAIYNEAELTDLKEIIIKTDSSYCVGIFNSWIYTWIWKGILSTKANHELINDIHQVRIKLNQLGISINFNHIPGHKGIEGNELADKLVNEAMDQLK